MIVDIDDREFVENIRIFFVDFSETLFVRRTNDNGEIKFEFGRDKRKVPGIDSTVFWSKKNPQFVRCFFCADVEDLVASGAKGEDKVARTRDRGE